jgi:tetratricopeptide (TPR) repeat protein
LIGLIGQGAQKRVFVARDTVEQRRVALARIDLTGLRRSEVDRLREVGARVQMASHPHIIAAHDVIEAAESIYVVSPYVEGGDLRARLESSGQSGLPLQEALTIASQVARALEHAHDCGIIHCDVKPANVLLDESRGAQVCDFGLARITGKEQGFDGQLAGTPAYLSPEQISDDEIGPAADLYSLGCLLYELLTGRPPFVGENASEVLSLHRMARPTPPMDRNPAIPTALGDLVMKLLEKDPAARPTSAREVGVALDGVLDSWTALDLAHSERSPDPASMLVGRREELERFDEAMTRVRSGQASVLLLQGEAGMGKSSLLRALASRADAAGFLVLYGQAIESSDAGYGTFTPYGPFVSALLPIAARLSEIPQPHARMLRDLLFLDAIRSSEPGSSERGVQHHRLFAAVVSALSALSQSRPIALVLDDLHWADPASLDLLHHLAAALEPRAGRAHHEILVVGCHRPVEPSHPLGEKLAALRASGLAEFIELRPLDVGAVANMLELLDVRQPSDHLVHRLHEISSGNPLFVRELIERIERHGGATRSDGMGLNPLLSDDAVMPASVESAIAERVEGVDREVIELLSVASFLGARFATGDLVQLTGHSAKTLAPRLAAARRAGLIAPAGADHRFTHPLVRHVLQQQVDTAERERRHLRIAHMLAESGGRDLPLLELEVAHHLRLAGTCADPAELVRYAGRAADHALEKFASYEAATLIQAALDAVARGVDIPPADRAELHCKAGLAFFRRLDKEPCLKHYDAAAQGFREAGDRVGLVRALHERLRAAVWLGVVGYGSVSDDVVALESEVRALSGDDSALRAQTLNTLCESYWTARQHDDALRVGAEAFECANRLGSDQLRSEVSINLGLAYYQGVQLERAMACWRIGVVHGRRAGDLSATARCLQRILLAQISLGRLSEAERGLPEVHEMNRVLQLPGETSMTYSAEGIIATLRGDYAAADASCREALEHVRRSKYPWGLIMCVPTRACAHALRGDAAAAHAAIDHYLDSDLTFEESGNIEPMADALRWLVDYYVGNPVAIPSEVLDGLIAALPNLDYDVMVLTMACNAVEFAEALRSPPLAEAARGALQTAYRDGVAFTIGWPFLVPRVMGLASSLLGDWDAAEEQLGRAIELGGRLGADVEVARARLALAEMLSLRHEQGDRERARELLAEAMPTLQKISRTVFFGRAEKLARYLDGEKARRRR